MITYNKKYTIEICCLKKNYSEEPSSLKIAYLKNKIVHSDLINFLTLKNYIEIDEKIYEVFTFSNNDLKSLVYLFRALIKPKKDFFYTPLIISENEYIKIYDNFGREYSKKYLCDLIENNVDKFFKSIRYKSTKRCMRQRLRYPKTFNEIKQDDSFKRSKRNSKNLPTVWDDQFKKLQRNWKKYRKTRYKIKDE